jgi:hypothetical protein
MKNKKLEKIGREIAHPFMSLLPNQQYFEERLEWYMPYKGILESSAVEIVFPMLYLASSNPNPVKILFGGAIILDGIWRINDLFIQERSKRCSGTNFLEIPYGIYKKIRKK